MRLEIHVTGDAAQSLRDLADGPVERARRELVRQATIQGLQMIIQENPVETGRSRAAWVQALEQLGGNAPAGWEGADSRAVGEGRSQGQATQAETDSISAATATNGVDYVRYLEYGTSRVSPFAMVRRSLQRLRGRLAELFQLESFRS